MSKRRDLRKERFWRDTMGRYAECGLSVGEFCEREGLAVSSYYHWRRELSRRDVEVVAGEAEEKLRPTFVPVEFAGQPAATIEIELPRGALVRVPRGCDATTLDMVLAALESASC